MKYERSTSFWIIISIGFILASLFLVGGLFALLKPHKQSTFYVEIAIDLLIFGFGVVILFAIVKTLILSVEVLKSKISVNYFLGRLETINVKDIESLTISSAGARTPIGNNLCIRFKGGKFINVLYATNFNNADKMLKEIEGISGLKVMRWMGIWPKEPYFK